MMEAFYAEVIRTITMGGSEVGWFSRTGAALGQPLTPPLHHPWKGAAAVTKNSFSSWRQAQPTH